MVTAKVADQLTQWIEAGRVEVGSYLPPMRELASQFGVSLHTVGVAIKQLETQKLVECLPRQGAKVTSRMPADTAAKRLKHIAVFVVSGKDWILASRQASEWGHGIVRALEQELFADGFTMTLLPASHPADDSPIPLQERLDRLGDTLRGGLCFTNANIAELIEQLRRRDVPWVSINRPSRQIDYNHVDADNIRAGWKVGRLFAGSGFRQVMMLASNTARPASDAEMIAGVFQAYVEEGVSTEGLRTVSCGDILEMNGYRTTRAFLQEGHRPQAIFATGDLLACGAMHALKDAGIRVPEEVSVIGATGLAGSADYDPPLTVVAQPMDQMGRAAGRMLRQMIAEGTRRYAPRKFDCPLIVRASTNISQDVLNKFADECPPAADEP